MIEFVFSEDLIEEELAIVPLSVVKIENFIHEVPGRGKRMSFNIFLRGLKNGYKFKNNALYRGHTWNAPDDLDFNLGLGAMQNCFNDRFPVEIKKACETAAMIAGENNPTEYTEKVLVDTWFYADEHEAEKLLKYATIENFLNPPTI